MANLFDDLQDIISDVGKKHSGFNNMSDDDVDVFKQSEDFNEYKASMFLNNSNEQNNTNVDGKSVSEIFNLSSKNEKMFYSFNSFEHYDIDLEIYQDIVDMSPVMQETLKVGNDLLPTFKYLHQDLFLSLYKYKAVILSPEKMHNSTRMNRGILNILINTPQYIKLRQVCRMDQFNAAVGCEVLGNEAIEILKEAISKMKDFEKKKEELDKLLEQEEMYDELMEENEKIDELLNEMDMFNSLNNNSTQVQDLLDKHQANEQNAKQVKAIANAIAEKCDELVKENSDTVNEISRKMTSALEATSKEIQDVSKLCTSWGMNGGDGGNLISFDNKKEAIETIRRSPKLTKLTNLIGRFKESAITEQKKKAKHGAVEIKSVTVGDKIQDTLPSERMNLVMEPTKADFYRRMTEKQLMVYSKESNKQKNKGPIIVCVDTSGSMSGEQEKWSKALTVGVLEVAQMQKRDFACIMYSSYADEPIIIKKDEVAPNKIIKCAEVFHNGGTDFEEPLKKAIKLIKESTFKDADILFITDGDCGVSDKFLREYKKVKEDKNFKTLGILVDIGRGSHCSDSTLKEFCDNITTVSNVAQLKDGDSDVNKSIFGSL